MKTKIFCLTTLIFCLIQGISASATPNISFIFPTYNSVNSLVDYINLSIDQTGGNCSINDYNYTYTYPILNNTISQTTSNDFTSWFDNSANVYCQSFQVNTTMSNITLEVDVHSINNPAGNCWVVLVNGTNTLRASSLLATSNIYDCDVGFTIGKNNITFPNVTLWATQNYSFCALRSDTNNGYIQGSIDTAGSYSQGMIWLNNTGAGMSYDYVFNIWGHPLLIGPGNPMNVSWAYYSGNTTFFSYHSQVNPINGQYYYNISCWDSAFNNASKLLSFIIGSYPKFSNINCTSCNIPYGDIVPPYTTSDTTPTFDFTTDSNAYCRISDENLDYQSMGELRNCTTGEGSTNHICTLTVQDELTSQQDYVYISCADTLNTSMSNTTILEMNITDLPINISKAIDYGIQNSVIWPGATIYSNQQVYLRNLNNQQVLATVDRVAVYGNQRWIINYNNQTKLGLFNITPVIYVLDFVNTSLTDIEQQIPALINSTKN